MLLKQIVEEVILYEGLEITHSIDAALTNLIRMWSFDGKITYDEINKTIRMTINESFDIKDFDIILKHIENFLGYFPSHIVTKKGNFKFDYTKAVNLLTKKIKFGIYFDAKYDQEISEKKLPLFMYHITSSVNENKILKIGLVPKKKDKLSNHPDRIYLTFSPETAEGLLGNKSFIKDIDKFTLFSINFQKLKAVRKIRFFTDPIYAGKGCYTYENIPSKFLTIIKRIDI